jgi:hypothetical protein
MVLVGLAWTVACGGNAATGGNDAGTDPGSTSGTGTGTGPNGGTGSGPGADSGTVGGSGSDAAAPVDASVMPDASDASGPLDAAADSGAPPHVPKRCSFTYYVQGNATPLTATLSVNAVGSSPNSLLQLSQHIVPMSQGQMAIAEIVAPSSVGGGHSIAWAEYAQPATFRLVYASQTACDMTTSTLIDNSLSGTIALRTKATGAGVAGGELTMEPGQTWFVMFVDSTLDATKGSPTLGLPLGEDCGGQGCQEVFILE